MSSDAGPRLRADQNVTVRTLDGRPISFQARTITSETNDLLLVPTISDPPPPVMSGGMRIRIIHEASGGVFYTDTEVISIPQKRSFGFKPAPMTRLQRRNFFRVYTKVPVWFSVLQTDSEGNTVTMKRCMAETEDLSGGGLCFETDMHLVPDDRVEIGITLTPRNVETMGRITRNLTVTRKGKTRYQLGLQFTQIAEKDRDAIIRYLFEYQKANRAS